MLEVKENRQVSL